MQTLIKKTKIPFKAVITIGILPSFLKKAFYRWKGHKIGKNVSLGLGSVILGKQVNIRDNVKVGLLTIIRAEEIFIERFAAIGSFTMIDTGKLQIGEDARINEQVIVGGMKTPQSALIMGKRTIIMEYSFINTTMPITIGDDTGIGGHCLLFTHGSWLNQLEGFPVTFAPITIGKSVWLPWRVFIMPGVTIGDKVVIGANSMINKSVQSNCLVAGSPAKVIKENFPEPLTPEQKFKIFNEQLEQFIQHLIFHEVTLNKIEEGNRTFISGKYKKDAFTMVIITGNIDTEINPKPDLLIYNISEINEKARLPENMKSMVLNIREKTRSGSSKIGEEYVKFVSRFGLRFNRLD
jgi:acetyltransferase-like isoleucine patch superfamily enzyme